MHKKVSPKKIDDVTRLLSAVDYHGAPFPHCDPRVLHAPGECEHCDKFEHYQALRQMWSIAFTGYTPEGKELPCPVDHARGEAHAKWYGNVTRPLSGGGDA